MRKHQYRGQRVDTKEWVYGYYVKKWIQTLKNDGRYEHYIVNQMVDENEHIWNETFQVIPETVGEMTGLPDKSGKEIYEGDIYHQGDSNILYVVEWHDTGLQGRQQRSYKSYAGLTYWLDRIEIIGNIHDNPELLK